MPDVYPDGNWVPELEGFIHGGIAVVMHQPEDVNALEAICHQAPRPPEIPIESIYKTLSDRSLNFEAWGQYWRSIHPSEEELLPAFNSYKSPVESDVQWLEEALHLAGQHWRRLQLFEPVDAASIALVLFIAKESPNGPTIIHLESEKSAFALQRGSILASLVKLPFRVPTVGLCFVLGGGVNTSSRSSGYVKRLRQRAQNRPNVRQLRDISEITSADIGDRRLTVLVHGLLATDIGTFNELQRLLEEKNNAIVVGFPHDTLAHTIEGNAKDLAQMIHKLGTRNISIAAHSRGGLAARAAARQLKSRLPAAVSFDVRLLEPLI